MSYLVLDRTEAAFVKVLQGPVRAANDNAFVTDSGSGIDKVPPMVTCSADGESFEEEPHATGNFWVMHTIRLVTKAPDDDSDTPEDDRQALITAIETTIMVDDLEGLLTAAQTDYTVFPGSIQRLSPRATQDGDMWIDEFPMKVYCCVSDLS